MRLLSVQLQPNRSASLDVNLAVLNLRAFSNAVYVSEGYDDGPYVNVVFKTADPAKVWASIQRLLETESSLASATIVVCQGKLGWDDYLLLHHFDAGVKLDSIGQVA
jgi:hypothetical protein